MLQIKNYPLINRHFSDLNPLVAGWEKCKSGHSFGPYVREYYLIHYIVSGKGTYYTADNHYCVQEKQTFLIRPHEVTTYTADKQDPWHYIWIGFDGTLASCLDTFPPVMSYSGNTFSELLQCEDYPTQQELFITAKLFEILSELLGTSETKKTPKYERLAADYIRANYMRPLRIEEIAALIGVNRQYLSRLFKSAYGISMQQFLVRTRLHHAVHFLQNGSSVTESAYLCGYEDVFNFSKMFKKEYGVSPSYYQQSANKLKLE